MHTEIENENDTQLPVSPRALLLPQNLFYLLTIQLIESILLSREIADEPFQAACRGRDYTAIDQIFGRLKTCVAVTWALMDGNLAEVDDYGDAEDAYEDFKTGQCGPDEFAAIIQTAAEKLRDHLVRMAEMWVALEKEDDGGLLIPTED